MRDVIRRNHAAFFAGGFILAALLTAASCWMVQGKRRHIDIAAVTGATPLALKTDVPGGLALEVSGDTERIYRFGSRALDALAPVYRRTLEVSPDGEFEGSYRYCGIPVLHILEGVVPKKAAGAPFDRPLDMIVAIVSRTGEERLFSYGELTMADDSEPVMLAYARSELLPAKAGAEEAYEWNRRRGPLAGLRLVCPGDRDTGRYLDDVVRIVLAEPVVDVPGLPEMKRGERCVADSIAVVSGSVARPLALDGVETAAVGGWVRTGHGLGFKGISAASGYDLRALLRRNFPGAGEDQFYLFVACDGYRAIFSGREIFGTEAGRRMLLIEEMDGQPRPGGASLGPVKDYFVDRVLRAVTHIVMLEDVR